MFSLQNPQTARQGVVAVLSGSINIGAGLAPPIASAELIPPIGNSEPLFVSPQFVVCNIAQVSLSVIIQGSSCNFRVVSSVCYWTYWDLHRRLLSSNWVWWILLLLQSTAQPAAPNSLMLQLAFNTDLPDRSNYSVNKFPKNSWAWSIFNSARSLSFLGFGAPHQQREGLCRWKFSAQADDSLQAASGIKPARLSPFTPRCEEVLLLVQQRSFIFCRQVIVALFSASVCRDFRNLHFFLIKIIGFLLCVWISELTHFFQGVLPHCLDPCGQPYQVTHPDLVKQNLGHCFLEQSIPWQLFDSVQQNTSLCSDPGLYDLMFEFLIFSGLLHSEKSRSGPASPDGLCRSYRLSQGWHCARECRFDAWSLAKFFAIFKAQAGAGFSFFWHRPVMVKRISGSFPNFDSVLFLETAAVNQSAPLFVSTDFVLKKIGQVIQEQWNRIMICVCNSFLFSLSIFRAAFNSVWNDLGRTQLFLEPKTLFSLRYRQFSTYQYYHQPFVFLCCFMPSFWLLR